MQLFEKCISNFFAVAQMMVSLLRLPHLMKDDAKLFITSSKQKVKTEPCILYEPLTDPKETRDVFTIMADGEQVCTTDTLTWAVKLLVATYYVFNIAYPKKIAATMQFIQEKLLDVHDDAVKNPRAVSFAAKLLLWIHLFTMIN